MGWLSSLVGGVVGFFIGGPVGAAIGAGIGATKVGEKVVNAVMDFVLQPFMPDIPNMGADEASRQQGILIQTQGSTVSIPVVYGYRKVGGAVVFAETGSTNNKYLYVAYVFSEGLVEGLREVYIDDWLLPTAMVANLNAGQLVNITTDKYANRVQMRWYPGTYFANPRSSTVGTTVKGDIFAEAPSFTSNMNYNGLAVLFARYEWKEIKTQEDADANPFKGNIPEIQVSMLGKRVASLLVDTTENTAYDSNSVRYSTNPAECLLDYLRNPRYGKGLVNDDIDWTSWKRAARKCNQTVTYIASGIQGPILTLNAVVDTNASIMANTKNLLNNFRAYMPYVQGKYKLKIEDAGHPTDILSGSAVIVQTFTKDDIVSDITFNGIDRSSKYNVVSVTYVDPDQKWSNQQVVYPETEAERQTYIVQDGNRENKYETTCGAITNYAIAKDMARLIFNKQRYQESCVFTATSKALELEPGDCIRIQSNILNFGTDPWRVVSYKVNNDMTVDLGCVRNPDSIYPYVRVGEEDIVLPPYIPKGSIIYFPGSSNVPPIGLVPPLNAIFPTDVTGSTTNPNPTDPTGSEGGGVGGSGPDDLDPTTPVGGDNTTPTDPPPPPAFEAVLVVKSSTLQDWNNGTYSFNTVFTQPSDAQYSYSMIWWRPNAYSPWSEIKLETAPGAGGDIPWVFGPLPSGLYDFYARCYASDGRASTKVLQGQFGSRYDLIQLGRAGFLGSNTITVTEGWSLPSTQAAPAPRYDDNIDMIKIRPKLSGGAPTDPRTMTVTMQQITSTLSTAINTLISGVKIYYKHINDNYWSYEEYTFPQTYLPGQVLSFDLAGDFGVRIYPSEIIPNTSSSTLQRYEFMARLVYADGKAAEKQLGPATGVVEKFNGSNDFISWGTDPYGSAVVKSAAIPSGFNSTFLTVDQDPNKSTAVGLDIVPGVSAIIGNRSKPELTWNFNSVANTKFRGFKIRFREVILGENPSFTELTVGGVANLTNQIIYKQASDNFKFNSTYDFVVTAQISTPSGIVDATNSLVSRVKVLADDPDYANLYSKFNFAVKDTVESIGNLKTTFPATPVINVKSWTKKIGVNSTASNSPRELVKIAGNWYLNHYYQLRFQIPNTADALVCYRRVNNINYYNTSSYAKYWGQGGWEKIRIELSSIPSDADGWRVLNFRGPIDPSYFTTYTGASVYSSLYSPLWKSKLSGMKPYYGAGNAAVASATTKWAQFLFVIEASGVEGPKGLLLREFAVPAVSGLVQKDVDGFIAGNVAKDTIIDDIDIFNNFDSGYYRNLDEAWASVDLDKLVYTDPVGQTAPSDSVAYTYVYDKTIQQPTTGDQVY